MDNKNHKLGTSPLNEAMDKEQTDLKRVIKTMKDNRDEFKKLLKNHRNEFSDFQQDDLKKRIEFLDHLIKQNSMYLVGEKTSGKAKKGYYDPDQWTRKDKLGNMIF